MDPDNMDAEANSTHNLDDEQPKDPNAVPSNPSPDGSFGSSQTPSQSSVGENS